VENSLFVDEHFQRSLGSAYNSIQHRTSPVLTNLTSRTSYHNTSDVRKQEMLSINGMFRSIIMLNTWPNKYYTSGYLISYLESMGMNFLGAYFGRALYWGGGGEYNLNIQIYIKWIFLCSLNVRCVDKKNVRTRKTIWRTTLCICTKNALFRF